MKAFARHRNTTNPSTEPTVDHDAPTGADEATGPDDHGDPGMGDDFLQRLGDLDQFIGTATTAPTGQSAPVITRFPAAPAPLRNTSTETAPALPSVPPATRRLFDARATAPVAHEPALPHTAPHETETSEADDFLQRLGDLDRFIGGPTAAPAPTPAPVSRETALPEPALPDTAHHETDTSEADDFLQRLGDLDRFIGGSDS
ncbi:MAG: hypothetical protein U0Q22_09050 [Acidimicrobiales bacterium]